MRTLTAALLLFSVISGSAQPPAKKEKPKKPKIKDPLVIKISTQTGQGNKYAGSGANKVFILINGEPEKKYHLTNKSKPFQRGALDKFQLDTDLDPATIESVRLVNESDDMWKCETITFQFFKGGKESKLLRHTIGQFISNAHERKALHAKPYVDIKMKVLLEEPKPPAKSESGAQ